MYVMSSVCVNDEGNFNLPDVGCLPLQLLSRHVFEDVLNLSQVYIMADALNAKAVNATKNKTFLMLIIEKTMAIATQNLFS